MRVYKYMEIVKITIDNTTYLTDFLKNDISNYFRYYTKSATPFLVSTPHGRKT